MQIKTGTKHQILDKSPGNHNIQLQGIFYKTVGVYHVGNDGLVYPCVGDESE